MHGKAYLSLIIYTLLFPEGVGSVSDIILLAYAAIQPFYQPACYLLFGIYQ